MKSILLPIALALAGCATPIQRIVETPSGKPEVIIKADVAAIKASIIGDLVNHNYTVEKDSEYLLEFSRPTKGMENFAAAMVAGNSYSTNARIVNYTFVRQPDGVRVIIANSVRAQMPGGQTRTEPLHHNELFNTYQKQLEDIKSKLEKSAEPAVPSPEKTSA